jgi:hypothetical protein
MEKARQPDGYAGRGKGIFFGVFGRNSGKREETRSA